LLVECNEPRAFDRLSQLSDFVGLSRLHSGGERERPLGPCCTRAAEDRRNASDECDSMDRFPLNWPRESLQSNVRCRAHRNGLSERVIVGVSRRLDRARLTRPSRAPAPSSVTVHGIQERPKLGFRALIDPPTHQPNAPRRQLFRWTIK
jgi:hypothetical protein